MLKSTSFKQEKAGPGGSAISIHSGLTGFSPEETDMADSNEFYGNRLGEKELLVKQSLKYADDLVKVYEEEKARRKALETANRKLKTEIGARRRAEKELRLAWEELERKVEDRTEELSTANERLRLEVTRRTNLESELRGSLKEKEVLLSEIHHRVKNNLQIVSSLLALQLGRVEDEKVIRALEDSQSRIRSMALIHEQLYRSGDLAKIDFSEYLKKLVNSLLQTQGEKGALVHVSTHVHKVLLDLGLALPCSLIINELLTNCLKHAFPQGQKGEIRIEFLRDRSNSYRLTVADNGKGLPGDFDYRKSKSLGLQLVVNLAELQLQGALEVRSDHGTSFIIEFQD